ncbi:MAG: hypothetical protein MUO19_02285, partial [Dehalococcoidales bacterium]|nr:hypothetical protein [Dehalococcoidales bacterium]
MAPEQNPSESQGSHLLPFSSKELALLWKIPITTGIEPDEAAYALRERIKELNCLYGISQMA